MALTRTQINDYVAKMHGSSDLGSGGVLALKDVLNALNGELLEEAPIDGNQYGRENGAWTVVTGGGGNAVQVPVVFGLSFSDKAQTVVTGQSWVLDLTEPTPSNIVGTVVCPSGVDPDEMYLYDFQVVISDLVTGIGFTVTVYSAPEAQGTYDVMCIGV